MSAENSIRALPGLKHALESRCDGVSVAAHLQSGGFNPEPVQTVTFGGCPDDPIPACVPPEALAHDGDYIDEYGTTWICCRRPNGWYVIQHARQHGGSNPVGSRRWPLKWCEAEVTRIINRARKPTRRGAP